ncbi:MAG: DUF4129 domain-containing protein [Acidobacteria bacterium]|nr:DUF4129 domain-containing protein [Acidobacteriota bacterium]
MFAVKHLQLAPLGAGDLIDRTVRLYRRHFGALVRASTPPVIVSAVGTVLWSVSVRSLGVTASEGRAAGYFFGALAGAAVYVLGLLAQLVVVGGASRNLVMHLLWGEPVTARLIYRSVRSRLKGLFWATVVVLFWLFISTVAATAAGLLLLLPGFAGVSLILVLTSAAGAEWVGPLAGVLLGLASAALMLFVFFLVAGRVAYVPQVLMVEGRGVFDSVGRSAELARGNVRRLTAMFLFTGFAWYAAAMLLLVPLGWYAYLNGVDPLGMDPTRTPVWYTVSSQVLWQVSTVLLAPVWMMGLSLLYVDERVRHEGYDIELLAAQVFGEMPAVPAGLNAPLAPAIAAPRAPAPRAPSPPERPAGSILGLCLLLAVLASGASAQPSRGARGVATLADYRGRVGAAVAPLEELAEAYARVRQSEKYEVWSKEGFNSDFIVELPKRKQETLARVGKLLPARERVEGLGGAGEVDNGWVQEALAGLESEKDSEALAAGLRALAGRLRALEARLGELDASAREGLDRDAERGRLNSILRRPEFDRQAPKQQSALERMIEDFAEWWSGLFPRRARVAPGGSPRVSMLMLGLVGGLCLAVLAYVGRRLWLRRGAGWGPRGLKRGARVVLGERVEADQTAADLLDEAERLARAGELRGAIRKAYVALLCELGDRGVVRLAQHKTNRDYLDAVRRAARPALYTELLPLTNAFELHWYGLRPATDADWQGFKTRCRTVLDGGR